jgi:hypothetical protein
MKNFLKTVVWYYGIFVEAREASVKRAINSRLNSWS